MKVNRVELRDKLSLLKPGLGKKEVNPQETHFLFLDGIIATFNGQVLLTAPFTEEIGNFSVKAEEFFRLVDGISDDTIDIVYKDYRLKLKSKSTSASMVTYKPKEDGIAKTLGINDTTEAKIKAVRKMQKDWKKVPDELIPGMHLCSFAASLDLSSAIRACVCVAGDHIFASDNARVSRFILPEGSIEEQDFNIQARFVQELAKLPITEYCMTNSRWVHFRTEDGTSFSCGVIEGELTGTVDDIFDGMEDMDYQTLPDDLSETLNSVVMLASDLNDQRGRKTLIKIKSGKITIKADNEIGDVEKTIPFDFEGEGVSFYINNNFLTQILKHSTTVAWDFPNLYFSSGNFSHFMLMLNEDGE
jgi:hypothetical protein